VNPLQKSPAECRAFPESSMSRKITCASCRPSCRQSSRHEGPGPGIAAAAVTAAAAAAVGGRAALRRTVAGRRALFIAAAGLGGRHDFGQQRLMLQLVEEAGRRIAARGLPALDHDTGLVVELAGHFGVEAEPVSRRCTSRRCPLSRPIWSSLTWLASSVKVAGSIPGVRLRVAVEGPFSSEAIRASASDLNWPLDSCDVGVQLSGLLDP